MTLIEDVWLSVLTITTYIPGTRELVDISRVSPLRKSVSEKYSLPIRSFTTTVIFPEEVPARKNILKWSPLTGFGHTSIEEVSVAAFIDIGLE